ncbi:molybdopterin converting factor subunit 1 [Caenispirillum bisanense]|uniref:molybdopterin converting factor subunit 1 n=1 Tax=Caenispirillum bisanense TaxID=414052 RepID=UPI003382CFD6
MITVLYFAWLRDGIGTGREEVAPPPEVATVGTLLGWLAGRSAGHGKALADPARLRCAVNQDYAGLDAPVKAGDEVAFFPPVTGG